MLKMLFFGQKWRMLRQKDGFKQQEQRKIVNLVNEHIVHLNQQWDAYCGNG